MKLRVGLLLVLCGLAAAEQDLAALVRDLGGADASRRSAAYQKLMREKDPRAIPLLAKTLPQFNLLGQTYGISLLQAYPPKLTRAALRTLVKSEIPYLRLSAAAVLHRTGERGAVEVITKVLAADVPPATLVSMLSRLYSIRDERVLGAVRAYLDSKRDATVIGAALYHANNVQDKRSLPPARKLLEDPRPGVRAMAAAREWRGAALGQPLCDLPDDRHRTEQRRNRLLGSSDDLGLDADPSQFDEAEWLAAPYTEDGETVYAVVHNEYRGFVFDPADRCPQWRSRLLHRRHAHDGDLDR